MSKSIVPNGRSSRQASPAPLATPHVALYMRVSTEDQADRGTIDAQRDFLRQCATKWQVGGASAVSADYPTAPALLY